MSIVDVDSLLSELDPASPCGPDLEYDPVFLELEQAALGKPEVQYGDTITPAVPPEWKVVKKLALELFARSRDLRLAVPLLRALLALHGVAGFADGARLIERLLEERWDKVHPQLDPDDDNDPTLRINSLATLADPMSVVRELKDCTLLMLPGLGPLTLRALEIASGEVAPPEGTEKVSQASLERALHDADPAKVEEAAGALVRAFDSVSNIEVLLVRAVGSSQALNLDLLTRNLRRARDFLSEQAVSASDVAEEALAGDGAAPAGAGAAAGGSARGAAISGDINDRNDVLRMLDKINQYYARHEPSSPVPMLIERARRLATMSFFEIMEDLAPEGVAQVSVIRGPQPEVSQGE